MLPPVPPRIDRSSRIRGVGEEGGGRHKYLAACTRFPPMSARIAAAETKQRGTWTRYCGPALQRTILSLISPGELYGRTGAINPRTRNLRHYCAPRHARTHAHALVISVPPLYADPRRRMFSSTSLSNQRCCSAAVHLPGDKCVFRVIRDGFGPVSRLLHMKQLI